MEAGGSEFKVHLRYIVTLRPASATREPVSTLPIPGKTKPINEGDWSLMQWPTLYSAHQTNFTLRVKRSHMSQAGSHKGKPHVAGKPNSAETCLSTEAWKQTTTAGCNELPEANSLLCTTPGRGSKAKPKKKNLSFAETELTRLLTWLLVFSQDFGTSHNSILGHRFDTPHPTGEKISKNHTECWKGKGTHLAGVLAQGLIPRIQVCLE